MCFFLFVLFYYLFFLNFQLQTLGKRKNKGFGHVIFGLAFPTHLIIWILSDGGAQRCYITLPSLKVGSFQFAQAVTNVAKLYKVLAPLLGGLFIILISSDFSLGILRNVNLLVPYRSPVSHNCRKQKHPLCTRLAWSSVGFKF